MKFIIGLLVTVSFYSSFSQAHDAHAAPAKDKTPAAHAETKGVDADQALSWLKNGNTRFVKGNLRKDGQNHKDVERLSKGQAPHTIVLSCSDSRVPPEIVFDQKLGEIFTVRTAGEIPDQAAMASIEYAVEHLGAKLILVMGHTSCGAVKAGIATAEGGEVGSPSLNYLVAEIQQHMKGEKRGTASVDGNVEKESWMNARGVAKDLMTRSKIIAAKVKAGSLKIETALYHLDSGKVHFE